MSDTELLRSNKEYILDEYLQSGKSQHSLAKEFDVNAGTLWYVLDSWGVAGDNENEWQDDKIDVNIDKIIEKYEDGDSITKISNDLSIAHGTVKDRLDENDVDIRSISEQTSLSRTTEYNFTEYQLDIIYGELLGDGSLVAGDGFSDIDTYCFNLNVIREEHCEYVKKELPDTLFPDNQPYRKKMNEENWQDQYIIRSGVCPTLTEMESDWYDNRNKFVPKDLSLNETVLKHWYWGDGSLSRGPHAELTTVGFDEDSVYHLSDELKRIGYENYINEDKRDYNGSGLYIRLSVEATKKMINNMKFETSCYDYKLETDKIGCVT